MGRPPVEYAGRAASPGLADGPVFPLDRANDAVRDECSGDPAAEKERLAGAVETAVGQIAALMDRSDEETAAILEFQMAMLEDDALSAPAFEAVAAGRGAVAAWTEALAGHIAEYEAADDDYFRARAADLTDLRDRVLRNLSGDDQAAVPPGAILAGEDITPTRFLETDWTKGGGVALSHGSPSSHAAMLARSRGVPMATGLGIGSLDGHDRALLDGYRGRLILSPDEQQLADFARASEAAEALDMKAAGFLGRPAMTRAGEPVNVMVNIADPGEVDAIDIGTCDGVGLMRTEFLFHGSGGLPDEDLQYEAYRRVLLWAGEKPVTIRTVDAGGDKPVPGLTLEEDNPFLGLRGIRLSLSRSEVFRVQLRALARAGRHGNLKIMLPMVSLPGEVDAAVRLLEECVGELIDAGVDCVRPPVGIMVEVPAAAITPELFAAAQFFSIGSNDLTQYVMAASRESDAVAALHDVGQPAVLALISRVCRFGAEAGIEVSLCGDAGGDPAHIEDLLKAGLRTLSVAPAALARAKMAIAEADTGTGDG